MERAGASESGSSSALFGILGRRQLPGTASAQGVVAAPDRPSGVPADARHLTVRPVQDDADGHRRSGAGPAFDLSIVLATDVVGVQFAGVWMSARRAVHVLAPGPTRSAARRNVQVFASRVPASAPRRFPGRRAGSRSCRRHRRVPNRARRHRLDRSEQHEQATEDTQRTSGFETTIRASAKPRALAANAPRFLTDQAIRNAPFRAGWYRSRPSRAAPRSLVSRGAVISRAMCRASGARARRRRLGPRVR